MNKNNDATHTDKRSCYFSFEESECEGRIEFSEEKKGGEKKRNTNYDFFFFFFSVFPKTAQYLV